VTPHSKGADAKYSRKRNFNSKIANLGLYNAIKPHDTGHRKSRAGKTKGQQISTGLQGITENDVALEEKKEGKEQPT